MPLARRANARDYEIASRTMVGNPAHDSTHDSAQQPEQGELLGSRSRSSGDSGGFDQSDNFHDDADDTDDTFVPEPAKLMRIGGMVRKLLEEVRHAELDEAGRDRMRDVYNLSVEELATAVSEPLAEELHRLALAFDDDIPSGPELRIAQAQLVGWLEGLFHGIQAAVSAQQMMAERQLRSMRGPALEAAAQPSSEQAPSRTGVYL